MNGTRALIAISGAAFVAAGMYEFGQRLYGDQMADGFTVWDAVSRDVVIVSVLVALALASPYRRGLRVLWMLAGALWIWLLVLPPIDTADAGPPGVPLLFRFQSWSGIALPLFLVTLAHWRTAFRGWRDLRTPAAVLAVWIVALTVCARYDWINTDIFRPGINYDLVALACWLSLAAPPLLLVRWILRRDREIHPRTLLVEDWYWSGAASRVRTRRGAAVEGVGTAAAGFVLVALFQQESDAFAVWMVLVCALLTDPWLGRALRRRAAAFFASGPPPARPASPVPDGRSAP